MSLMQAIRDGAEPEGSESCLPEVNLRIKPTPVLGVFDGEWDGLSRVGGGKYFTGRSLSQWDKNF